MQSHRSRYACTDGGNRVSKGLVVLDFPLDLPQGLDELVELRTLYLHQNCLTSIANLDNLTHLAVLNISNNWITRLEVRTLSRISSCPFGEL